MWWAVALLGALALSAQAPSRPTPRTPPRDARPARPVSGSTPAPANGVIRGRVVVDDRSETPVPIVKARVAIDGGMGGIEPVFTDSLGAFEFSLPAGHYTASAEKTGYAVTRYGAITPFDPFVPIDLVAGATEEIEIRMPKGAAIFGRIVDDLGDPVVGARVSAAVLWMEGTSRRLQPISKVPALTDDLGEYRVGGLPPGRYLLTVAPPSAYAVTIAVVGDVYGPAARRIGWGKTFYPSGQSSTGATPIDLAAGEEHGGIDLTVVPFNPARLSVTMTGGTQPPGALISMALRFIPANEPDTEAMSQGPGQGVGFNATSAVNVGPPPVSIDPGEWIIVGRRNNLAAIAHITLSSGDDASLALPLQPGARISGRIIFEGTTRRPPPSSVSIDVIGAGPDAVVSPLLLAPGGPFAAKPDGTFQITGVIGTIELLVADPIGWAVKSINAGDRDLLGTAMTFNGNESLSGLEVVLTDQVADLTGSVVSPDSRPAPRCKVAVFPSGQDATFNGRRMRLTPANRRGEFFVDDLPPGSYLAVAQLDINASDWTTPAVLNRLREGATPFTIASREKKTLTLQCLGAR